jgi:acyl carrier protein
MTEEEIFDRVAECISRTFRIPAASVHSRLTAEDVDGWDSLAHGMLMIRIEKACNVRLPSDIVGSLQNVGDIVREIQRAGTLA